MSLLAGLLGACTPAAPPKMQVVTTTSLLAYVTGQIGGDKVNVVNIIPPTQHPGDFDVKPTDIKKLSEASLFLWHNFPGEVFVPGLLASGNHTGLTVVAVDIKGSWMTPQVQRDAADKVAAALTQVDTKNASAYQQAALDYKDRVTVKENELRTKLTLTNVTGTPVIGSFFQAGLLGWAELKVVDTYPDPNALTPARVKDLVDKGKASQVKLVVDNLQNGADAGKGLAAELGAKRIVLSYFPGGFEDTTTWEKAIDRNVEILIEALAK